LKFRETMDRLILYGTAGCHLCEQAARILDEFCADNPAIQTVYNDIATETALIDRYGSRIPVVRSDASGAELDWPFDAPTLTSFLGLPGSGGPSLLRTEKG
jgi:hypothetical protein